VTTNRTIDQLERDRALKHLWYIRNKEKHLADNRLWRAKNADRHKAQQAEYNAGRREAAAIYHRAYRARNRERIAEQKAEHYAANRDAIVAKVCARQAAAKEVRRQRYRRNPMLRLNAALRASVSRGLANGTKGGRRTQSLLGYSLDDLRRHLESQFREGMTWDNYGDWHVDHIKPLSSFVFECPEDMQFKAAWALSNLQPLWAAENQQKAAKLASSDSGRLALEED
jgi:hypothetical protein